MPKRNVVIVGGGSAGATIARELSSKLDPSRYSVILVTSRPEFLYLPAALRVLVVDGHPIEDAFMPYDQLFADGKGSIKVATVTNIENNKEGRGGNVLLSNGEAIQYEALVLAPGSIWDGPLAFPETQEQYQDHIRSWRQKFRDAKHIVLVGGGSVAIEIAGEVKDVWPHKKVTIVHGQEHLVNGTYPMKWRTNIEKRMRQRGVDVILGDYIDGIPEAQGSITTRKGRTIEDVDLVVPTRGGRPNTSFLVSLQPSVLTEHGFVKVDPTLQVKSHPGIFAAGDVLDWKEVKQAAKVHSHAPVVVANILAYLEDKPAKKVYKGSPELIVITNGKNGGFAYLGLLWGLTFGDWFARMLKSKDLMVSAARKALGVRS